MLFLSCEQSKLLLRPFKKLQWRVNSGGPASIEACLFKHPFYKWSHSKGIKQRALLVHQRKTKHFIARLFAQPYTLLHTFSILVGKYFSLPSSQQLPRLRLWTLEGLFGMTCRPLRALNSPCELFPELQRYKDTVRCAALGHEVPGHGQEQLTQTLFIENALLYADPWYWKANRIELMS